MLGLKSAEARTLPADSEDLLGLKEIFDEMFGVTDVMNARTARTAKDWVASISSVRHLGS